VRKGMVKKARAKVMGEEHWSKRSRKTGQFMDQKQDEKKFKDVRREK
jgi:hypothetical protein